MYFGKVDWEIIRKVKEKVKILVVVNGDIIDFELVKRVYEVIRVDGIMIGRAVFGNFWVFF